MKQLSWATVRECSLTANSLRPASPFVALIVAGVGVALASSAGGNALLLAPRPWRRHYPRSQPILARSILDDQPVSPTGADGRAAFVIAMAAQCALTDGGTVKVEAPDG